MPTLIVNLRLDAFDVYIGRPGRGHSAEEAIFGNPFRLEDYEGGYQSRVAACLRDFQSYLLGRIRDDPEFRSRVLALRGRRLGCFCAPKGGLTATDTPWKCHGQVIAHYLDSLPEE